MAPEQITPSPMWFRAVVSDPAIYHIWLRMLADNKNQGAFWLNMDSTGYNKIEIPVNSYDTQGKWIWTKITSMQLLRGAHDINLVPASSGMLIDKVIISDDPHYKPATPEDQLDRYDEDLIIKQYKDELQAMASVAIIQENGALAKTIEQNAQKLLLSTIEMRHQEEQGGTVELMDAGAGPDFQSIREQYQSTVSQYLTQIPGLDNNALQDLVAGNRTPDEFLLTSQEEGDDPDSGKKPNIGFKLFEIENEDFVETDDATGDVQMFAVTALPKLEIESTTSTSVTYSVTFPSSGASGNCVILDDFNGPRSIRPNRPYDGIYNKQNGTYTIKNLKPGGFYILWLLWSTNGGRTFGGNNSYSKLVYLPNDTPEPELTVKSGTYVTAKLEPEDYALTSESTFNQWLRNMDKAYLNLKDLTGYTPNGGNKLEMNSTREDWLWRGTDETNYAVFIIGLAGPPNPIWRPYYKSHMQRLASDWGYTYIHEMGHNFDKPVWEFDPEVMADFKAYYATAQNNAPIYDVGNDKYYIGTQLYNMFRSHPVWSYERDFIARGEYSSYGMTAILIDIQRKIGWNPFKDTFRYLSSLSAGKQPKSNIDKLNLFLTKLSDFSGQDVFKMISDRDKKIIGENLRYLGVIGRSQSSKMINLNKPLDISLTAGKNEVYRVDLDAYSMYNIFTGSFSDIGAESKTKIRVFSDNSMQNLICEGTGTDAAPFAGVQVGTLDHAASYYIEISSPNPNAMVHTTLYVSQAKDTTTLTQNIIHNFFVPQNEYIAYKFTAPENENYEFLVGPRSGYPNADTYLELYRNSNLTGLAAFDDDSGGSGYSRISIYMNAGQTYYVRALGWRYYDVAATLTVYKVNSFETGAIKYNVDASGNSTGPKLGEGNTVIVPVRSVGGQYYIELWMGWGENGIAYKKKGVTKLLSSQFTDVTFGDITISGHADPNVQLKSFIKIYVSEAEANMGKQPLYISAPQYAARSGVMPSVLEFSKATDSNFIYANNPEYITNRDIVDDPKSKNLKFIEQKEVTGKNTFYQTHVAWWGGEAIEFEPSQGFYTDVDFYNPNPIGGPEIKVTVSNLAYGSGRFEGDSSPYSVLQNYFNGAPQPTTITISPQQHVLLFEYLNAPLFTNHPGTPSAPDWGWDYGRLTAMCILFDLNVTKLDSSALPANQGIWVSSVAAYKRSNLPFGRPFDGSVLYDTSPIITNPNGRPNEPDLYGKYQGIAENQSAWIDSNLSFVIDDNTSGPLNVSLKDSYYPDGVYSPWDWWMSHASPVHDKWEGRLNMMPAGLHKFTYPFTSGRQWNFDYEHRDMRRLTDSSNPSVNEPVDEGILTTLKQEARERRYITTPYEHMIDEYSLGMSSWGATYHYTITVHNVGSSNKTVQFRTKDADNMVTGYKESGASGYTPGFVRNDSSVGVGEEGWVIKSIPVPPGPPVTFEVVTMLGGGHGGLNNSITVQ